MAGRALTIEELRTLTGQDLGASDWHPVTQEEINSFAGATHDHQWIHVDPERAKKESPFGGPIAHGYYTLSLAPYLFHQVIEITGVRMGVNYGLNRLRFPAPLKIGQSIRIRAKLLHVEDVPGGAQATVQLAWEVKDGNKPVCVAEALYRYYP